jgi:hypothetical protein
MPGERTVASHAAFLQRPHDAANANRDDREASRSRWPAGPALAPGRQFSVVLGLFGIAYDLVYHCQVVRGQKASTPLD